MFLMFVITAMAMFYGRVYCGYLCPQMIFSETSLAAESNIRRLVNKYVSWNARWRNVLSRALFYVVLSDPALIVRRKWFTPGVNPDVTGR